jgi:acetate kinase
MAGPGDTDLILVLNAGSSSIKFAVFDGNLNDVLSGMADGIGGPGAIKIGDDKTQADLPDHDTALTAVLDSLRAKDLPPEGFAAAAHRVVHGGTDLTAPARITAETLEKIRAYVPLAPLHNPHNIAAMETLARLVPDLPQFASFDTAFHATMPEVERLYALPPHIAKRGIRRYGFHGTSYASLVRLWPSITGGDLAERVLAFHLGNGASLCAIREGRSVATTMGYSPLEGLTMGTRTGDIDANAVLRLAKEDGIEATAKILNRESGLLGLSVGTSDMRALLASDDAACRLAVDHFCHRAVRHAGALIAAMGGCDALAFTGGIGENAAPIRARIMQGLAWLGLSMDSAANDTNASRLHAQDSAISAWIIPAEEERMIAADALRLLKPEAE